MRSRPLSLGLLLLGGACSQIIGLGGYENTDAVGGAGSSSGGATAGTGNRGGTNTGGISNPGGGEAGAAAAGGSAGEPAGGVGGSGVGGDSGSPGEAGGGGGDAGSAGASAGGGSLTGGTAGRGGSGGTLAGGTGGTASGGAGKGGGGNVGTGGTATGGSGTGGGGKGGSATGGTWTGGTGTGGAGKGGSGGTTGGTATGGTASGGTTGGTATGGTGGAGCIVQDLLLGQNPNFDNSNASPPAPAPWTSYSTTNLAVVNRQLFLTNADVTAHTAGNAAWLGGVGSSYLFDDGGAGEFYSLALNLTIPVGATQVTLSCYYQTQTEETSATIAASRDAMVAWLWDEDLDDFAYDFQYWGPANTTAGWHLFSNTASGTTAAALAGRTLLLEFYAEVDDLRSSDFFIDTCSLRVTVCN